VITSTMLGLISSLQKLKEPKFALLSLGIVVVTSFVWFKFSSTKKKFKFSVQNPKKDYVYLFVFPGKHQASPFCVKAEIYLKLAGIPYELRDGDISSSPTNKLPYIEFNGECIYDSSFIIDHLKQKFGDRLDGHLSESDKAISLAWQRLFENSLYWPMVYERFADDFGWNASKNDFLSEIPKILRFFILPLIRRSVCKNLYAVGISRNTRQEISKLLSDDLKAISVFLGNKKYFMGTKVSTIDATVFGFIDVLIGYPFPIADTEYAKTFTNIALYHKRIKAEFYNNTS